MKQYRQGDVFIREAKPGEIPTGAKEVERDDGRVILAYGEVTGHAHAITDPGVKLLEWKVPDVRAMVVEGCEAALRHEEHDTIAIPPGEYIVMVQREYSPEAIRNVAD